MLPSVAAQFEITKTAAERLTFNKQAKPFSSGGSFSTAEILAGVRGTKAGYTVKSITNISPNSLANDGIDKMRAEMTEKDKESAVVYIK